MNKDELKDFVDKNKEAFDSFDPPTDMWDRLQKEKQNALRQATSADSGQAQEPSKKEKESEKVDTKVIKLMPFLKRVAAVILIAGSSIAVYEYFDKETYGPSKIAGNTPIETADSTASKINQEVQEMEVYYNQMVSQKITQVKKYQADFPGIVEDIKYDISELDSAYNDLKKDLNEKVANEEVIEAMIRNYRLKLDILEDLLSELKEKETKNNENLLHKS